jgi:hypothetical protein
MKPFVRSTTAIGLIPFLLVSLAPPAFADVKTFQFEDGQGKGSIWCQSQQPPENFGGRILDPLSRAVLGSRVSVGLFVQRPAQQFTPDVVGVISASDTASSGKLYVQYPFATFLEAGFYNTPPDLGFNIRSGEGPINAEAVGSVSTTERARVSFVQTHNTGVTQITEPTIYANCALPQDTDNNEEFQRDVNVLLGILKMLVTRRRPILIPVR